MKPRTSNQTNKNNHSYNNINNHYFGMNNQSSSSSSFHNNSQNRRNRVFSSHFENGVSNNHEEPSAIRPRIDQEEIFDKNMDTYFTYLEMYRNEYPEKQTSHIPGGKSCPEKYKHSGRWRAHQRTKYTKGTLSQERIQKIQSIYPDFF